MYDFLGPDDDPRAGGENSTVPVHPAVMSPLLVWAIRTVTDFAPDILAAWRAFKDCSRRLAPDPVPAGRDIIRGYLDALRASGQPLPTYVGRRAEARRKQVLRRWGEAKASTPWPHNKMIAASLAVSASQVQDLFRDNPEVLDGVRLGPGAPLPVPVRQRLDSTPWRGAVDYEEAEDLARNLMAAALIVIAYLSGMRPKVVLHLRRGCRIIVRQADGTVRFALSGLHFKGVTDVEGNALPGGEVRDHPWTVIQPVHQAVAVLEELTDGVWLFPRHLTKEPKQGEGQALTQRGARDRIAHFTRWINQLAIGHSRAHEVVPDDPDGRIVLTRFRRTIAWFINRRPAGRIALGIQYGHLHATMAENYGGRSTSDLLQLLDLERALSTAEALADAAEDLQAGHGVSGPAAVRFLTAVTEFQTGYEGTLLSARQHRDLLKNPRLQVFDHPHTFLTCNYDPFKAQCHPDRTPSAEARTPSHDRCRTTCPNIARTDQHMNLARREAELLDAEINDDTTPFPIRRRLQQRQTTLLGIISQHDATRIRPATTPMSTP
ncbi:MULTISPECIES: hypothetical protein [unclassified Streptomyces]|uniref:hypothetical protein n=1 Tax=unclassified Streptomyces TaxID=2593676 RepID=UPI0038126FF3